MSTIRMDTLLRALTTLREAQRFFDDCSAVGSGRLSALCAIAAIDLQAAISAASPITITDDPKVRGDANL